MSVGQEEQEQEQEEGGEEEEERGGSDTLPTWVVLCSSVSSSVL